MSSFTTPLLLEFIDGRLWRLHEAFTYRVGQEGSGREILVPVGFVTDFASIPRFFWRLLPPTGKYGKAAVVHDYLYNRGYITTGPNCGEFPTKEQADRIFWEAMTVLGVNVCTRKIMYRAVSVFGQKAWDNGHVHAETSGEGRTSWDGC